MDFAHIRAPSDMFTHLQTVYSVFVYVICNQKFRSWAWTSPTGDHNIHLIYDAMEPHQPLPL